jgi:hypothetical protein
VICSALLTQVSGDVAMAMAAGDLTNDGVIDLVLGFQHEVRVFAGKRGQAGATVYENSSWEVRACV